MWYICFNLFSFTAERELAGCSAPDSDILPSGQLGALKKLSCVLEECGRLDCPSS